MKTKKIIYLLGIIIAVAPYFLFSCKLSDDEDIITSLNLEISNEYLDLNGGIKGGLVEGAEVFLYRSDSDRLNEVNLVAWDVTESDGVVSFSAGLEPIVYYFDAIYNGQTNWDGITSTGNPLIPNASNNVRVNIYGRLDGKSPSALLSSTEGKIWRIVSIRNYSNGMELIDESMYRYLKNERFKLFKNKEIKASTKGKGEWKIFEENSSLIKNRLVFEFGGDNFMDLFNISNMTPTTIKAVGKIDLGEDCFIDLELVQ